MKLPRSRFTLSLRGLMLAVLIVGGVLGWKARRAAIQRTSVAEIERAGGIVAYDYQLDAKGEEIPNAKPWAPGWRRKAVGDEYFQEVVFVSLHDYHLMETKPGEQTLAAILTLDRLEALDINRLSINDAGLAHLAGMPRLKKLQLDLDATTDDGLVSLAKMPALEDLALGFYDGKLTRATLVRIAELDRLKNLDARWIGTERPGGPGPSWPG